MTRWTILPATPLPRARRHFNGSIVVPVIDNAGNVTEVYGRKLRDDLRAGTPLHLYLPGPHQDVWNGAALGQFDEIILCEALIDALTFWQAGFHNVTASYGVSGFTPDHLAAFQLHGTRRVLIAYDRDEAGDKAAAALAEQMTAAGIECYRIEFPKGMDASDYALKVTPAAKSLGILIRKAAWMGKGAAPQAAPGRHVETVECATAAPAIDAAPCSAVGVRRLSRFAGGGARGGGHRRRHQGRRGGVPFAERRYRVRRLPKNLSPETLKINCPLSGWPHKRNNQEL